MTLGDKVRMVSNEIFVSTAEKLSPKFIVKEEKYKFMDVQED